jgi:chromosome segregation protein SMC, common bacterial type
LLFLEKGDKKMYLKALEINGFKSFASKTVVEFDNGITSIVGPNGSGKSNILDAILWVLGEQSYKNIRAKESSDIIFSGSKSRKPKSMAEVSLIIENEDRYLDIDFSEIKITRRIFKSGENEYLLNNKKVRLKDINNLFIDTGIGKQAYSIIGQGRVERIISSSSTELKEIIEEAAGVKRAKNEKEISEKKLKEVKNEIEKIDYVEKDLEVRVNYLKKESEKARLFKSYTQKIDTEKYMILEYGINEKNLLKADYTVKSEQLKNKLENVQEEFLKKNSEWESENNHREELFEKLSAKKKENKENTSLIDNLKNEYSELVKKHSNLEIEANEKDKRKGNLDVDTKEKEEILKRSKEELDQINKALNEKKAQKDEIEKKVLELKEKKSNIEDEIKKRTQKNSDFEVDKIKLRGENEDLEKRVISAKNEGKKYLIEKKEIQLEIEKIQNEKDDFENKKAEKESFKLEKEAQIKQLDDEIDELRSDYSRINSQKNDLRYKYENLDSKRRANINIIEKNETFNRGIKYILNEKIDGVIGAFVNLIDIPVGYEEAIQTLSGGLFQDIIVKNTDIGKKCIQILKDKKLGRASFLPIGNIKTGKMLSQLPKVEGVIDFARNIVKYDKSLEKIVQFAYGNAVVVKNLDVGAQLSKNGFSDRIVTLEGDIITARGRMTGGHSFKGKDELLERKKELKLLEKDLQSISSEITGFEKKLKEITEKAAKLDSEKKGIQNEFNVFLKDYEEFNAEYDKFNLKFGQKERILRTLNYEIIENENFIIEKQEKITENERIVKEIEKYIVENNSKLEYLEKELNKISNLDEYTNELNAIVTEYEILKVKTENNKTRYREIEADYNKLVREYQELLEFEKKRDFLKEDFETKIASKKEEIDKKVLDNQENLEEIEKIERTIKEIEKRERDLIQEIKEIEMRILSEKNDYEKLLEKILKNENELQSQLDEFETIEKDKIKENEEYFELKNENELNAVKRKLSMNQKSREEIGSVNLASIEEFERENERYTSIVNQKKDLIESREALFKLIGEIEVEITNKFSFAYEKISENFKYMCDTILNGAEGGIKLTNPEDLLKTGLELSVRYKNKPEQTLMLLSGGEKSMLAVSFIMAIFMFKPSPFTFFDEIEAALDEKNTQKIVEVLHKFIDKSQFILITHNKETMKGSHRLYGVTMNKEIGETKLVSVDI